MTRFLCLAKLAAVLEMFDDFTSYCTIGYIEIDFTIQMNVAHNRRISIDERDIGVASLHILAYTRVA